MALTNHDLMAISQLMDQKIQPIHHRLDCIDGRLDQVDNRLDCMDSRLDQVDNRLDRLESNVSALKAGQIDLRQCLKEVNLKVSDTYRLALDAWGTSVENRNWLEKNMLEA